MYSFAKWGSIKKFSNECKCMNSVTWWFLVPCCIEVYVGDFSSLQYVLPNEEEEREGDECKKLSQRMNVRRSFLIFGGVGGIRGLS